MSYDAFSAYYDRLMSDCDYSARADYLLGLFCEYQSKPKLILDLCCGTGSMSIELLKRGIDVIAVDASEEMLDYASNKARQMGFDMLCLNQPAQELDLFGTIDGAICTLDSINHMIDYQDILCMFNRVSLFLEPGCLFIFDVNSEYKHLNVLGDNTFIIDEDDLYCVWQNSCDPPYTDITLDFFEKTDGVYRRSGEEFSERYYSDDELISAGESAGLELVEIFGDMSKSSPSDDCERKIFIMRKR